jgi:hypothetical protein
MQSWKRDAAEVERLRALLREAREHVEATLVDMATPQDRELLARIDAELKP